MFGLQQTGFANTNGFGYGSQNLGADAGLGLSNGLNAGMNLGGVDPTQQMLGQMTTQMTQLMQALMAMLSQNQGLASAGGSFGGGDGTGAASGLSDFLGGSSATGGVSGGIAGESGSKAVDIAKKYLGQKSGSISDLNGFTRTGQADNNCAEFVAACLSSAGTYQKKPGDASVRTLKQNLINDGWKKVSKEQSKPGDVAIFNGTQHIELVAEAGGKQLIGSNNKGGSNVQSVNMGPGNWGSVEYYSKG